MDSSYSACISVPHRTSFFFCSCSCEKLFWAWMQDSGFGICFRTAAWCCRELYILYRDNKYPVGENPFFPLKKELYQVMSSLLYITAQLKEVNFAVMFIARQLVHRSKPLKMQEEICLVCYSYLLFFFFLFKEKGLKMLGVSFCHVFGWSFLHRCGLWGYAAPRFSSGDSLGASALGLSGAGAQDHSLPCLTTALPGSGFGCAGLPGIPHLPSPHHAQP